MGLINQFNITTETPLPSGCTIKLRTYAKNGVGFGLYSEILSITSDFVPFFAYPPSVDLANNMVNPRWIYLTWQGIEGYLQTGGDDAIYYELSWD